MPPLIVVGMHRSGTTAVVEALQELGVFMGWRLERNREPPLLIHLNEWLLGQTGGRWDRPPDSGFEAPPEVRALMAGYVRTILSGRGSISYLGPRRLLQYGSPLRLPAAWGWKDPRTTLTLQVWLEAFPGARVVHIVRHGIDVAQSLKAREQHRLRRGQQQIRRFGWLYPLRRKRSGFVGSVRCLSLEGGFSLWEEYLTLAADMAGKLGPRWLDLRYEDLVECPEEALDRLATFSRLDAEEQALRSAAGVFSSDRRFAFREDPQLVALASQWQARLACYGYGSPE